MAPSGESSSDEDKPFECQCCLEHTVYKCTGESDCQVVVAVSSWMMSVVVARHPTGDHVSYVTGTMSVYWGYAISIECIDPIC